MCISYIMSLIERFQIFKSLDYDNWNYKFLLQILYRKVLSVLGYIKRTCKVKTFLITQVRLSVELTTFNPWDR